MTIDSPALRHILAVALVFAALGALWAFAVAPVMAAFARYDEAIEHNRDLLAHYLRIGNARNALELRLRHLRQIQSSQNGFLNESKPELAAASLVRRVKTVVAANDGHLQRIQTLKSDASGRFPRISVQVVMQGDISTVQRTFYGLETGRPTLFIDKVDIRRPQIRRVVRRGKEPETRQPPLQIRLTVSGYMKAVSP